MKHTYLPLALVVGILVFAGCAGGAGKDCGTDAACLNAAALACEPAHGTLVQESAGTTIKIYMEVKEGAPTLCTYYFRMDELTLSAGTPAQQAIANQMIIGKDMTCMVSASNMASAMNTGTGCTGTLVDMMQSFQQQAGG